MTDELLRALLTGGIVVTCVGMVCGTLATLQRRWLAHKEDPGECRDPMHDHKH